MATMNRYRTNVVVVALILFLAYIVWTRPASYTPAVSSAVPTVGSSKTRAKLPDGSFNGFDLHYVDHSPRSSIHCVGENFEKHRSWLYRSCEYTTFCFDVNEKSFIIYQDEPISLPHDWWSSTQLERNKTMVAAGAAPKTWFPAIANEKRNLSIRIGQFRPQIRYEQPPSGYYRFNATMLPFYRHPTSFRNPGHITWDDFMPLYTLLDMFDRESDPLYLALMRRQNSSEFTEPVPPFDIIDKFLPYLGNHDYNLRIGDGFDLKITHAPSHHEGPQLVCADHAIVGGGLLSDHGEKHWHGQGPLDRKDPYNIGRGGLFRRYRKFMMKNLGVPSDEPIPRSPYQILVSQDSSSKGSRKGITYTEHINHMRLAFGGLVNIKTVQLSTLPLEEQVLEASKTAIYITTVGGGTATAFFLPKGASLFLFFVPHQFLDFDVWNNFPNVKVHWIPMYRDPDGNMEELELNKFVSLVGYELNTLEDELTSEE